MLAGVIPFGARETGAGGALCGSKKTGAAKLEHRRRGGARRRCIGADLGGDDRAEFETGEHTAIRPQSQNRPRSVRNAGEMTSR